MDGTNSIRKTIAVLAIIAGLFALPGTVHAQSTVSPASTVVTPESQPTPTPAISQDDAAYNADIESLVSMTKSTHLNLRHNLIDQLRHLDTEWPRLMQDYVNPMVRSLFAEHYHSGLMMNTMLFHNEKRGVGLGASFGENDAQLNLTIHF